MMVKMILFKVKHTETVIENTVQEEAEVRPFQNSIGVVFKTKLLSDTVVGPN
jgi:hypothetical protein